jgi:tRNA pseudouridine55 synthase
LNFSNNAQEKDFDPVAGEILLVNKPLGWTSFDVVNKIRYNLKKRYKLKKIKVGHGGTLDPLATGLLIIGTGSKTKLLESLSGKDKSYEGTIVIGATRPSYDLETEVNETFPVEHITEALIYQTAESFLGLQMQLPPLFSAKKVDGKKAYIEARKGNEMVLQPNAVNITKFTITAINLPKIHFAVSCSKGTYIRSLAHDFGKALNSGAYLSALIRTESEPYKLQEAKELEDWVAVLSAAE